MRKIIRYRKDDSESTWTQRLEDVIQGGDAALTLAAALVSRLLAVLRV